MAIRLFASAAVAAGAFGLAVFAGTAIASPADDESLSITVQASCEYTDPSLCEDQGYA
jgi:hypothetical protein